MLEYRMTKVAPMEEVEKGSIGKGNNTRIMTAAATVGLVTISIAIAASAFFAIRSQKVDDRNTSNLTSESTPHLFV